MIPKVINYCWFGKNPLTKDAIKCIESWKKICPDYKIIEWNEDNYDVRKNKYMSDAYDEKKWAFVSDYARIDIIYNYGGIYLDTDVELVKPLDSFLQDKLFCGWESRDKDQEGVYENSVNFGLGYGAEKGNIILKDILELYDKINFINEDGTLNLLACPHYQTEILKKYGLDDTKRTYQKLKEFVVYPETFFSPKSMITGIIHMTDDTISIHHFSCSWGNKGDRFFNIIELKLSKIIGLKKSKFLVYIFSIPYKIYKRIWKNIMKNKRKNKIKRTN